MINHFEEKSVEIDRLEPDLYEFKTIARNDFPDEANPEESPESEVVEGRPLPGIFSKCYFYVTLERVSRK